MCFVATCHDNAVAEDFADNLGGFAGTVHTKVSELIRGKTLRMESAKAAFIAKERAASHGHAAGQKDLDGRIEPENGNAGVFEELGAARLGVRAAAESQDSGFLEFGGAAEGGAKLIRFDLTKCRFAKALENPWNGKFGGLLDAFIEVDETPRELPGQESADGCFAGTHEADQANHLRTDGEAAQRGLLSHSSV